MNVAIMQDLCGPKIRIGQIQNGEIHGMEYPDPSSLNLVRADENLQLLTKEGMTVGYLAMKHGIWL
jgi:pyruvate kinase